MSGPDADTDAAFGYADTEILIAETEAKSPAAKSLCLRIGSRHQGTGGYQADEGKVGQIRFHVGFPCAKRFESPLHGMAVNRRQKTTRKRK